MNTIAEGKQYLRDNWKEGVVCPCCSQFVKLYKRKLNSNMAIVLYRIFREGEIWIKVEDFLRVNKIHTGHDWALLRNWGLLEEKPKEDTDYKDSKVSGYWRITDKGMDFVFNAIRVPKHITMFNNKFYGYADAAETVCFKDCIGNNFNYNELMRGVVRKDYRKLSQITIPLQNNT